MIQQGVAKDTFQGYGEEDAINGAYENPKNTPKTHRTLLN